jgi:hypothetical protein
LVDTFAELIADGGAAKQWAVDTQIGLFFSVQNTLASQRDNQVAFTEAGGISEVAKLLKGLTAETQSNAQLPESKLGLIEGEQPQQSD